MLALLDRFVPRWISFPAAALLVASTAFFNNMQSLIADQVLGYLLSGAVLCTVPPAARAAWRLGSRSA